MSHKWVVCLEGFGFLYDMGALSPRLRKFKRNSRLVWWRTFKTTGLDVWLIGTDERWNVPFKQTEEIDILKTDDKYSEKICNVCHCLYPIKSFARNQNNKHGIVRRPSCIQCRTDIDKRAPKSSQAKKMEKQRSQKGDPFKCPICQKRSIVGVTAKIVADHDHHTGHIRDFICDSCNTGLGRFKNGEDSLLSGLTIEQIPIG